MENRKSIWRYVLVAFFLLVILTSLLAYYVFFDSSWHLREARQLTQQPDSYETSNFCNRSLTCVNGDAYHLYFYSTNGRSTSNGSYMITVVTLPNAEQYYKREKFEYSRSRAISDPNDQSVGYLDKMNPESDIVQIFDAEDISSLRNTLSRHGFIRSGKEPN